VPFFISGGNRQIGIFVIWWGFFVWLDIKETGNFESYQSFYVTIMFYFEEGFLCVKDNLYLST